MKNDARETYVIQLRRNQMNKFTRNTQILLLAATAVTLTANRAPGASTENSPAGSVHVEGYICVSNETSCTGTETPLSGTDILIKGVVPQLFFDNTTNTLNDDTEWYLRTDSNRFRLIDFGASGSRANEVFSIEALAPPNALRVRSNGFVGMGTSVPARELHIRADVLPAIRIQDASQTWEIEADAVSFAVYDQTNNKRMLQIKPGATSNSFVIAADGKIGMGTAEPAASLHVTRNNGTAKFLVEEASAGAASRSLFQLRNNGEPKFGFKNTAVPQDWEFFASVGFAVNEITNPGLEFVLSPSGNLVITGSLTTGGPSCAGGCDAVYSPGYQLEPIEEHAARMWEKNHLPAVGPTSSGESLNVSEKVGGLINEVEKAHIYIERLNEEAKQQKAALQAEIASKDQKLAELEHRLAGTTAVEERVARLERLLAARADN
jgi:hypothetical protein